MWIPAREVCTGDVLHLHDWRLHIVAADHDEETAVQTTEFDFPIHFGRYEAVQIDRVVCPPARAA